MDLLNQVWKAWEHVKQLSGLDNEHESTLDHRNRGCRRITMKRRDHREPLKLRGNHQFTNVNILSKIIILIEVIIF